MIQIAAYRVIYEIWKFKNYQFDSQIASIDKYHLLLTNPHDALHHGKRAAKVDAQCDKLATELSRQRLRRSTFSSYSEWFVESQQF